MHISVSLQQLTNINNVKAPLNTRNSNKNLLDSLAEQKENLINSKNDLIENTLKKGDSLSSIKDRLKSIDDKINEVDKQIGKLQSEQIKKKLGNDAQGKKDSSVKQDSNNDQGTDNSENTMHDLLSLSGSLRQSKSLSSQRKSMTGEMKVLNYEIKLDEKRGINPAAKIKRVSDLQDKITNISYTIGDIVSDINNRSRNIKVSASSPRSSNPNNSNTDTAGDNGKLSQGNQNDKSLKLYQSIIEGKTKYSSHLINGTVDFFS